MVIAVDYLNTPACSASDIVLTELGLGVIDVSTMILSRYFRKMLQCFISMLQNFYVNGCMLQYFNVANFNLARVW